MEANTAVSPFQRSIQLMSIYQQQSMIAATAEERYRLFLEMVCKALEAPFAMLQQYLPDAPLSRTLAVNGEPGLLQHLEEMGIKLDLLEDQHLLWPRNEALVKRLEKESMLVLTVEEILEIFPFSPEISHRLLNELIPHSVCQLVLQGPEGPLGELLLVLDPDHTPPDHQTRQFFQSYAGMMLLQEQATEDLKKQERRWRDALESSEVGVWDLNNITNELYVTRPWAAMLGYELEEIAVLRRFFNELLHPEDRKRVLEKVDRFINGHHGQINQTFRMRHKNGQYRWILSRGKVVEKDAAGSSLRLVGTHIDITRQKQMEEDLRKNNELIRNNARRLERSVHLKETRLLAMEEMEEERRKAEQANQQKDLLFASLSHDLKNPMSALTGLIDLMLLDETNEEKRSSLDLMKHSTQTMLMLLNGLLDFSRMESGKLLLNPYPFDLASMVERVWSLHHHQAGHKNLAYKLHIHPQVPRTLVGDSLRLEQIITNLLSNAIKFTRQGSVTMQINLATPPQPAFGEAFNDAVSETPVCWVRFDVTDTGIGIPEEAQKKVFDCYQQASADIGRHYGGSGLGLCISKQLADKMGGSLTVTSTLGKGSRFSLLMPFQLPSSR
ncbi:PAS domain-containing sensor histidine kinase [Anoxynatronum buryatiense]|uniref:Circadian input-output histidine kinase CikA n=1 Tax=Anoxynatronum buryatiense TaxID=489973 RepID=A0AA46AIU6_9CLOT|nr:ATP-binding protein [Anoxynatronum buryatiense]SMP53341.1 PAS domain S-box-containing protein [Anoxynatronum buryatiense]